MHDDYGRSILAQQHRLAARRRWIGVAWVASLVFVAGFSAWLARYDLKTRHAHAHSASGTATSSHVIADNTAAADAGSSTPSSSTPAVKDKTAADHSLAMAGSRKLAVIAENLVPPKHPDGGVSTWCREIVPRAQGVDMSRCMHAGLVDSHARSVDGRPLVVGEERASTRPVRGRILLIGATHGDEPSTIGTLFDWISHLNASGSAYDWYWIPTLNPDGVMSDPETRVNAHGVDLNRNLPTPDWKQHSDAYWRRVGFEKRRFPGPSAGSEPENQWLVKQIADIKPDVIVTLHAPYGVLDYDGDFPPPQTLGRLKLHRLGIYPGSLGNFGFHVHGIPVMTLELESSQEPPPEAQADQMWSDLNDWLARYLSSVREARSTDKTTPAG